MPETARTISITGIDGSGKTTTVESLGWELSPLYCVGVLASLRSPSYVWTARQKIPLMADVSQKINRLYQAGQQAHRHSLVLASMVAHGLLQRRLLLPRMLRDYQPDLLVSDRDWLVDAVVMLKTYGLRGIPAGQVAGIVETIGGKSVTDNLFLLTASPWVAAQRLAQGNSRDHHESPATLSRAAQSYPEVISLLTAMGRIGIWQTINTEALSPPAVVQKIRRQLGI